MRLQHGRILIGDCRESMRSLSDCSVNCIVTSPPYFGLRDYGVDGQIGRESTPADYISKLVGVLSEAMRVLRDDGTMWLNLGDSYCNPGGSGRQGKSGERATRTYTATEAGKSQAHKAGFKPKDRMLIPARVAIAMQEKGFYIRDEIVWHKPRTTPAPVKDRTVAAHEMIYLITKKPKYSFDYLAIEEPLAYAGLKRKAGKTFRDLQAKDPEAAKKRPSADRMIEVRDTRRKRSVWSVSPSPYKEAHFATYPPDLIEPCILAGCPEGGTVLDPFFGAGTTGLVAQRNNRQYIGCELNEDYALIARNRLDPPIPFHPLASLALVV